MRYATTPTSSAESSGNHCDRRTPWCPGTARPLVSRDRDHLAGIANQFATPWTGWTQDSSPTTLAIRLPSNDQYQRMSLGEGA